MSNVTIMTMIVNGKQYTNDLTGVKVGDKVFHVVYGECDVTQIYYGNKKYEHYCQIIKYNEEDEFVCRMYITIDGKYDEKDYMPSVWIENVKSLSDDKTLYVIYNNTIENI